MGNSGMTEEPKQEDRGSQGDEQQGVSRLLVGVAIAGAVLLVIGLWAYVGPSTPTQKKDFVQAGGVLLAGLVGLGGLFFTWQNLKQTRLNTERQLQQARESTEKQLQQARESQERAQASAQETLRLTEQGQITERFTRAIDQLGATDDDGNPRLEIRLGGIYALERIDKESPERAYHSTVMEVLTAYVRENASWPAKSSKSPERDFVKPPKGDSVSNSTPNEVAEQDEGAEQGLEPTSGTPRTDIRAVLDVLKRREEDRAPEKHRVRFDLRTTDLQEADLLRADLLGANLLGARELTQEQIEWTIGSNETKLPEGLNRPQSWSKSIEEQTKIVHERFLELRGQ